MTDPVKQTHIQTLHEAVAVFDSAEDLQATLDDLQSHGFMRQEISVLADEKTVEKKLGHVYRRIRDAEDDSDAPRTIFVPNETIGEAEGTAIGLPLYIAAVTATGLTVASGGTLLSAMIVAAGAGAVGATIGAILAQMIARHHAQYIQEQLDLGGLLLWVHLRAPEMRHKALDILKKHSAHDIHIHAIRLNRP